MGFWPQHKLELSILNEIPKKTGPRLACSSQKSSRILVDLYFQFSNFGLNKQTSKQSSANIDALINQKYSFPTRPSFLLSPPPQGGEEFPGYSICSPANFWRSPDDTPRNSAIANQTSSPRQSHHALRPGFLHILGRRRG